MFGTVHSPMHATNKKLEGNVWEMYSKSLHFKKLSCSVLPHFKVREMFSTVHSPMHTVKIIICGPRRKQ